MHRLPWHWLPDLSHQLQQVVSVVAAMPDRRKMFVSQLLHVVCYPAHPARHLDSSGMRLQCPSTLLVWCDQRGARTDCHRFDRPVDAALNVLNQFVHLLEAHLSLGMTSHRTIAVHSGAPVDDRRPCTGVQLDSSTIYSTVSQRTMQIQLAGVEMLLENSLTLRASTVGRWPLIGVGDESARRIPAPATITQPGMIMCRVG